MENCLAAVYNADELLMVATYNGDGNNKDNKGSGNSSSSSNSGNRAANNGEGGNSKDNSNTKKSSTATFGSTGNDNATNAEENNSQNQSGILFPIDSEVSDTEQFLIDKIKSTGKQKKL